MTLATNCAIEYLRELLPWVGDIFYSSMSRSSPLVAIRGLWKLLARGWLPVPQFLRHNSLIVLWCQPLMLGVVFLVMVYCCCQLLVLDNALLVMVCCCCWWLLVMDNTLLVSICYWCHATSLVHVCTSYTPCCLNVCPCWFVVSEDEVEALLVRVWGQIRRSLVEVWWR